MWVLALDPWKTYFLPPKFSVFNGKMKTTIFALLSTPPPTVPQYCWEEQQRCLPDSI